MKTCSMVKVFNSDIEKTYQAVCDFHNYSWRSDLARVEVVDSDNFIEHSKNGIQTKFKIINKIKNELLEFMIENKNLSGRWIGEFKAVEKGTQISFSEHIQVKGFVMGLLVKPFLSKQQKLFIEDLERFLSE